MMAISAYRGVYIHETVSVSIKDNKDFPLGVYMSYIIITVTLVVHSSQSKSNAFLVFVVFVVVVAVDVFVVVPAVGSCGRRN